MIMSVMALSTTGLSSFKLMTEKKAELSKMPSAVLPQIPNTPWMRMMKGSRLIILAFIP
jgi:hypothetical protein